MSDEHVIEHYSELPEPDHDDFLARIFPYARYLEDAKAIVPVPLSPTDKKRARAKIAQFCNAAEKNRANVHYSQHRPFVPKVTPTNGFTGDCSSYETQCFDWVKTQLGIHIHDPNGLVEWDGYGFTGTLLSTNHAHHVPFDRHFFVGDIAICGTFWSTVHAFMCKQGGDGATSVWSSHGSEAGPLPVRLHYRPDVLGVYRPLSLL